MKNLHKTQIWRLLNNCWMGLYYVFGPILIKFWKGPGPPGAYD